MLSLADWPVCSGGENDLISTLRLLLIDVGEGPFARDFLPTRTSPLLLASTYHKMLCSARTGASLALRGKFTENDVDFPRPPSSFRSAFACT